MRTFKPLMAAIGMAGLMCASTVVAADKAQTTLRFSNWLPPAHEIVTQMLQPWAKEVERVTEGRVRVQFINALGKPQAHLDLVRNGVADLGMSVHTYTARRFPLTGFAELPFTTDDGGVNSVAYWRTYQKYMMSANEHRGVKLLGLWTSPATSIFTVKAPVERIGDLKGAKLRSPSPLFDSIGRALSVVTVNAPASESYEMLSRGVIDGLYFQYDQILGWKLDKLIRMAVKVPGGFGKSSQYLIMNERKWRSLSAEDQRAIDQVSGETIARRFGEQWQANEQAAIERLSERGLKTLSIEGEALEDVKQKLAFVEKDWLEDARKQGIDGKAALDYFREQIRQLSGQSPAGRASGG